MWLSYEIALYRFYFILFLSLSIHRVLYVLSGASAIGRDSQPFFKFKVAQFTPCSQKSAHYSMLCKHGNWKIWWTWKTKYGQIRGTDAAFLGDNAPAYKEFSMDGSIGELHSNQSWSCSCSRQVLVCSIAGTFLIKRNVFLCTGEENDFYSHPLSCWIFCCGGFEWHSHWTISTLEGSENFVWFVLVNMLWELFVPVYPSMSLMHDSSVLWALHGWTPSRSLIFCSTSNKHLSLFPTIIPTKWLVELDHPI